MKMNNYRKIEDLKEEIKNMERAKPFNKGALEKIRKQM